MLLFVKHAVKTTRKLVIVSIFFKKKSHEGEINHIYYIRKASREAKNSSIRL